MLKVCQLPNTSWAVPVQAWIRAGIFSQIFWRPFLAHYLSISAVTFPLHRHIRPVTTNGALSPHNGAILPPWALPRSGGLGVDYAGSLSSALQWSNSVPVSLSTTLWSRSHWLNLSTMVFHIAPLPTQLCGTVTWQWKHLQNDTPHFRDSTNSWHKNHKKIVANLQCPYHSRYHGWNRTTHRWLETQWNKATTAV